MLALLALMWTVPWLASQTRLDSIQTDLQHFSAGQVDSPIGARLKFLSLAWDAFLEHPWAGVGLDQFDARVKMLPVCAQDLGICQLGHAHNDIAHWSATLGIPGLLVIIAIYLLPLLQFVRIIRADNQKTTAGAAWTGLVLVLVFFLSGMTQSMFSHALTTMAYVIFVGLLLGLALRESAQHARNIAATE
jgi:O-antigen ligase